MKFKTVENTPRKKLTLGKVLLTLLFLDIICILGLVVVAYLPQFHRTKDVILQTTFRFNIALIVILFLCAMYYIFFRSKDRKYLGDLELNENEIIINNTKYPLSEIEHLRLKGNDIRGEFRGFLSKGTENQIFINNKNGEELVQNFLQTKDYNLKNAAEILKKYHQKGKLSEANLASIMSNSNYY